MLIHFGKKVISPLIVSDVLVSLIVIVELSIITEVLPELFIQVPLSHNTFPILITPAQAISQLYPPIVLLQISPLAQIFGYSMHSLISIHS